MKTLREFLKTTLIGGLLVVLPTYLALLLLVLPIRPLDTSGFAGRARGRSPLVKTTLPADLFCGRAG